jgi:hypothetical protein
MRIRVAPNCALELGTASGWRSSGTPSAMRGRLPRVIVGRRADAAEREHDVAAVERFREESRERIAIVAFVVGPREREAARRERRDDVREVAIGALA